ncbi:MAG: PTS lactose/cellobiose transporter subunit IIA [Erysipelotrichaceae bacterium]|nr:PTS lactose/cellobiose transporter subunit IIA [Erysipelotrichaceae bacterium]
MEGLELISFQIIAAAGAARSTYVEAIEMAKEGKIEEARASIKEGENVFIEAHKVHMELLTKVANQEKIDVDVLLIHAEDQLMSAETLKIMAEQMIDIYEAISKK